MENRFIKIVLWGKDDGLYGRNEKPGEETGLVFDSKTKVVYYMVEKAHTFAGTATYSGFMAPYISEKGKYCRFIDNQIIEIVWFHPARPKSSGTFLNFKLIF